VLDCGWFRGTRLEGLDALRGRVRGEIDEDVRSRVKAAKAGRAVASLMFVGL
jgi:hypothetical protein